MNPGEHNLRYTCGGVIVPCNILWSWPGVKDGIAYDTLYYVHFRDSYARLTWNCSSACAIYGHEDITYVRDKIYNMFCCVPTNEKITRRKMKDRGSVELLVQGFSP